MKTLFDPVNRWLGAAPLELAPGNKRPVALDDTLDILVGSGPVNVDVLANDFDPEGATLTLISASAGLGSAVIEVDNTVTYTPLPIVGFDTVIYEIADDLDQRRFGQINVTVRDPELTIDVAPNNTLVVNAEIGLIDITVTEPAIFTGTYQANTVDLAGGPVNLVPPVASGLVALGQNLTSTAGLWIYDTGAGTPTDNWQWLRSGVDIVGATSSSYTVVAADVGQSISVRQTLTDTFGQRSAISAVLNSSFTPVSDAQLIGWWDAADAGTIGASGGDVSTWADKAGGTALQGVTNPITGVRTLNGLNVIDCTGVSYFEAPRTLPVSGDVAIHMALIIDSISNAFEAVLAVDASNDFQVDANSSTQFDGRLNAAGIGTSVNLNGGPFAGGMILSVIFDRTGNTQAEVFVAGTSRGSMTYSVAIDASVALHIMTNRSRNAWVDGAVAELIVTGDIANRADHHSYLASKWGLT